MPPLHGAHDRHQLGTRILGDKLVTIVRGFEWAAVAAHLENVNENGLGRGWVACSGAVKSELITQRSRVQIPPPQPQNPRKIVGFVYLGVPSSIPHLTSSNGSPTGATGCPGRRPLEARTRSRRDDGRRRGTRTRVRTALRTRQTADSTSAGDRPTHARTGRIASGTRTGDDPPGLDGRSSGRAGASRRVPGASAGNVDGRLRLVQPPWNAPARVDASTRRPGARCASGGGF